MPNAKDTDIPIELLRKSLDLDLGLPSKVRWRFQPDKSPQWNGKYAGKPAGTFDGRYWHVQVEKRFVLAHRIVYVLTHGRWPPDDVDHENRDPGNNEIENLRDATHAQNMQNVGLRADNTSGVKGVSWDKSRGKWKAEIEADERINLGRYDTRTEARDIRIAAEMVLHPFRPKPEPIDPLTFIPDGVMVTDVFRVEGKMRKVPKMDKPTFTQSERTIFTYDEVTYV